MIVVKTWPKNLGACNLHNAFLHPAGSAVYYYCLQYTMYKNPELVYTAHLDIY